VNRPSSIEEFERQYAERAGVTVEYLHSIGRYGETCACGAKECEGFAMGHQWEDAIVENSYRRKNRHRPI
jgi:hypothetical protein